MIHTWLVILIKKDALLLIIHFPIFWRRVNANLLRRKGLPSSMKCFFGDTPPTSDQILVSSRIFFLRPVFGLRSTRWVAVSRTRILWLFRKGVRVVTLQARMHADLAGWRGYFRCRGWISTFRNVCGTPRTLRVQLIFLYSCPRRSPLHMIKCFPVDESGAPTNSNSKDRVV